MLIRTFSDGVDLVVRKAELLSLPTELLLKIAKEVAPEGGRKAGQLRINRHLDVVVTPVAWSSLVLPDDSHRLDELCAELLRNPKASFVESIRYNGSGPYYRFVIPALQSLQSLRRLHLAGSTGPRSTTIRDHYFRPEFELKMTMPPVTELVLSSVELCDLDSINVWAPQVTRLRLLDCRAVSNLVKGLPGNVAPEGIQHLEFKPRVGQGAARISETLYCVGSSLSHLIQKGYEGTSNSKLFTTKKHLSDLSANR